MATATDIILHRVHEIDYEVVARLQTAVYPDTPTTAEELRDRVGEQVGPGQASEWIVAEDRDTRAVVGVVWLHQRKSWPPDKFRLRGHVRPDFQRRGIGRLLMETAQDLSRDLGAKRVQCVTREDRPRSTTLMERAGFSEEGRDFESRLDVATCNLAPFVSYVGQARKLGVELTTLADELGRDPSCLPAIYQSHCTLAFDVPREEPGPPPPHSFKDFLAWQVEHRTILKEAYFLAKRGDAIVGESQLKRSVGDAGVLYQDLTAVVPAYRGQGVAMALKVLTVQYAQRNGYREIRTDNHTRNAPMLAINAKLGFVRQPAWIFWVRTL